MEEEKLRLLFMKWFNFEFHENDAMAKVGLTYSNGKFDNELIQSMYLGFAGGVLLYDEFNGAKG